MSFISLNEILEKEVVPGFKGKFVHSEHLTVVHWKISAGSKLEEHNHPHEQITNVIDGVLELTIGEIRKELRTGEVAIVPSNIKHQGRALTDCYVVDVFYPTREDYRIEQS